MKKLKKQVNQSPLMQSMYNIFKRYVHVIPFYLVEEGFADENSPGVKPKMDMEELDVVRLTQKDILQIVQNSEVPREEKIILSNFPDHVHGMGIQHGDAIIAYMFYNLKECDSRLLSFSLKENEAYIMGARTFSLYRGMNLSPFLRCRMCAHLREIGRTRYYSITEYFNSSALRLKRKINSRNRKLLVWISFADKFKFSTTLRNYRW